MTSPTGGGHVGDLYADIRPDVSRFADELKAKLSGLTNLPTVKVVAEPDLSKFAAALRQKLDTQTLPKAKVIADPDVSRFARDLRDKLKVLNLPKAKARVEPDVSGFAGELKTKLAALTLPAAKVNLDLDTAAAQAKIATLQAALTALGSTSVTVTVTMPTAEATGRRIGAAAAKEFVKAFNAAMAAANWGTPGPGPAASGAAGGRAGGAYASTFRSVVTAALANLPEPQIGAATGPAEQAIRDIRQSLVRLGNERVGITISSAQALAEAQRIRDDLQRLRAMSPIDVNIDADARAAQAALAQLEPRLAAIGRDRTVRVRTDTSQLSGLQAALLGSTNRIQLLITAGLALGPAIVPAAAAAAAAIASIGGAAISAVAGLGVGVLAFSGVIGAVKALSDARNEQAKTNATLARQDKQLASGADQVKSAVASLANTRAQAASQARQSEQSIADAERAHERSIRDVARAQADAIRIQEDLARAREDAVDSYEDLNSAVANNALAIERAELARSAAEKERDEAAKDQSAANARRRQETDLAYREAAQQLADLTTRQGRLAEEKATADRVGIEGSAQVVAAQQRIADSQDAIAAAREREQDAVRALDQARIAAAEQARQSDFSIAQAKQAVIAAERNAATAAVTTAATSGAAMDTLREKMDALSPAGQRFARFIFDQRSVLLDLRAVAETGVLPGFQRSIEQVLAYRGPLTAFVGDVAEGLGSIGDRAGRALTSQQWRPFFTYVGATAVPTMDQLARSVGNVSLGLANMVVAFGPVQRQVGGGIEDLTERFANWSASLDRNNGFQRFLDYTISRGPIVLRTIGDIGGGLVHFLEAAAPIGDVVLTVLSGIAHAIEAIPTPVLTVLLGTMTALRVATLLTSLPMQTLATNLRNVATGATSARTAMGGMVSFIGGPWNAAIAAATIGIGIFLARSADQRAQVDRLKSSLDSYASTLRGGFTRENVAAAQEILKQDKALRGLVSAMDAAGISQQTLVGGLNGDRNARKTVVSALDEQILAEKRLQAQARAGSDAETEASARHKKRVEELERMRKAFTGTNSAQAEAIDLARKLAAEEEFLATAGGTTTATTKALAEAHRVLADSTSTAEQRTRALQTAYEAIQKAAEDQIETEERYSRATLNLTDALAKNKGTLDVNTRAGLDNRDALQEALRASVARYEADIAAGVTVDEATRRHNERVKALVNETAESGKTKTKADELRASAENLAKVYGQIPGNVKTEISAKGVDQVFKELVNMQIAQRALAEGISPDEAWRRYGPLYTQSHNRPLSDRGFADGGRVYGPGGPTEDRVPAYLPLPGGGVQPIRLSAGEFVQPTASVDYYGQGFHEAVRRRLIPRELVGALGFAEGGSVTWPFVVNVTGTHIPTLDEVRAAVIPKGPALGAGGIGSERMMAILRSAFPGLPLYSGFRPGSRTASGSLSYHAYNRAVDLPPRHDVFNFIHDNYFGQTRELIWLGQYLKNIHNGRHHVYSRALLAQHGVAGMPNGHIHWALSDGGLVKVPRISYDRGGPLPPGITLADNQTGRTEWINTAEQQELLVRAAVGRGDRGSRSTGVTMNIDTFNARDSDPNATAHDLYWLARGFG